jgi:ABC-type lipoprotein release transport system permease subunit
MYRAFLALRWLLRRPINLLGVLAITVGVWALVVVVALFSGYLREIQLHLQSSTADMTAVRLPDDVDTDRAIAAITADTEVAAAAPRIVWQGLVHPIGDAAIVPPPPIGAAELGAPTPYVTLLGVDFDREDAVTGMRSWLRKVRDPQLAVADPTNPFATGDDAAGIIVGKQRLVDAGNARLRRVKITVGRLVRQDRQEKLAFDDARYTILGAFQSDFAAFDGLNVLVHIDTLRAQLQSSDPTRLTANWCNEIAIKLVPGADPRLVAERLQRMLRESVGYAEVRTWAEMNGAQIANIEHQRSLLTLVLLVIMIVAAFQVYATMSMTVTEKQHDIGILTALGGSRAGILLLFLGCGTAIALVGALLGVAIGCFTAIELDSLNRLLVAWLGIDLFPVRVYNLSRVPYLLEPGWIASVASIAVAIGALASAVPAWRASRHDPAVALRCD